MPKDHKIDIERLSKGISDLSDALARLGRGQDLKDLLLIIKRPGWTTLPEFLFAIGIVDSMIGHVKVIEQMQSRLMEASRNVGAQ